MSTSSKIIEKEIQIVINHKNSPKPGFQFTHSPQLTPRSKKKDQSSLDDDSSVDREELLLLEIRQLKRQNKFLKKKIQDLLSDLNGDAPVKKKHNKGAIKENVDSVHLTADFFFEEINNLMNGIVNLFRVEFSTKEIQSFSKKYPEEDQIADPTKKYLSFKKFTLNRRLEKIVLEKEEKRYLMVLDVFTDYFRIKEENQKHIIKVIDGMTAKAIDLNKMILHKVQEKRSFRSGGVRSHYYGEDKDQQVDMEELKLPWTFNRISSPGSFLSQNPNKRGGSPLPHKKL